MGIRAQFHFTLRKGALWRQWLSHGNCEHKALGSIPARVETYRRLRAIWPGVRSASSPTIPMAYSLYHGPSNLMLGELGTSVLNPGRPNIFFHLIFYSTLDKNNIFGHI